VVVLGPIVQPTPAVRAHFCERPPTLSALPPKSIKNLSSFPPWIVLGIPYIEQTKHQEERKTEVGFFCRRLHTPAIAIVVRTERRGWFHYHRMWAGPPGLDQNTSGSCEQSSHVTVPISLITWKRGAIGTTRTTIKDARTAYWRRMNDRNFV
jgi:hypothetical protein